MVERGQHVVALPARLHQRGGWWRLAALGTLPLSLLAMGVGYALAWVPILGVLGLIIWGLSSLDGGSTDTGSRAGCLSDYPTVCVPDDGADYDCADVSATDFAVPGDDPMGFDRDGDGIGCES